MEREPDFPYGAATEGETSTDGEAEPMAADHDNGAPNGRGTDGPWWSNRTSEEVYGVPFAPGGPPYGLDDESNPEEILELAKRLRGSD